MDNQIQHEEIISNTELSSIYKKISIEPDNNFDDDETTQMIEDNISEIFPKELLLIESKILINDINKLNNTFVMLLKHCNTQNKYKNVAKIFLVFCDYFDLEYHKCFSNFHEKLQKLIEFGFIKMIGGKENYSKLKKKLNPNTLVTIFDLLPNN